jgi:hypothetical protein
VPRPAAIGASSQESRRDRPPPRRWCGSCYRALASSGCKLRCSIEPLGDADDDREDCRHPLFLYGEAPLYGVEPGRHDIASSRAVIAISNALTRLSGADKRLSIAVKRCCRSRTSAVSVRTRAPRSSKLIFSSPIRYRFPQPRQIIARSSSRCLSVGASMLPLAGCRGGYGGGYGDRGGYGDSLLDPGDCRCGAVGK